jgi:signal transduction histidine kinase
MPAAHTVQALESVTLQLKWTHAFQFAGYYAAIEKGYYRDAGLEVRLNEAGPGADPVRIVSQGNAEYGTGNSSLLLARQAGLPVIALAVILQHSPLVLIAKQESALQGIHDLSGKRIMIEPNADELVAYLKHEGITTGSFVQVEHSQNLRELTAGKVHAISAYVTSEPWLLDQMHFPYQIYTPRAAGIDFYGDNLFTSEEEIKNHPKRVSAFREASLRGWKYAMEHQEEIAELIFRKYSQRHPIAFLLNEAQRMLPLMRSDLIEIGYMTTGRWSYIANTYADFGLLPRDISLDGFLYQTSPPDLRLIYTWLGIATLIAGLVGATAIHIYRGSRKLAGLVRELQDTQDELARAEMAQRNLLTVASHEFRNPAAVIKSSLDSLGFIRETIPPEVEKRLTNIRNASSRLNDLANNLLTDRRLRQEVFSPNIKSVDMAGFIRSELPATEQNSRISLRLPEQTTMVEMDPSLIRIALHNLIDNAIRHTRQTDTITVSLQTVAGHVELQIADTGKGIIDKERVFDPYFSSSSELTHGLGLSIVRTIARLHGGDAFMQDNQPRGTIFVIRLPQQTAA